MMQPTTSDPGEGATKGRGKLDRYNTHALPVKAIYLHPLVHSSLRQLTAPLN